MPYAKLIPFEEVVTAWPADLFSAPPAGSLGIVGYEVVERGTTVTAALDIALASDLTIGVAGLDGFELVLPGDPDNPLRAEATLSSTFGATIEGFDATLRVRSDVLVPVQWSGTPPTWTPVVDSARHPVPLELAMNVGAVVIDESLQPRFELDQSASLNYPFMIGATGLVVEATNVRPLLSANEAPPVGLAPGFRGLSIELAAIHLPDAFALDGITPDSLALTGLAIGSGGVSGGITGSWTPQWSGTVPSGPASGTLLGVPFALRSLGIAFAQNAVTGAQLSGDLVIPFFDARVAVTIQLGLDGSFLVELNAPDPRVAGPLRIDKAGIGSLELTALALRRDDDGTALFLSGRLTLEVGAPALQWPTIEVQDLRIGPDGGVQIPGGWLDLQQPLALDLYGFGLEITRVGFGNEADGRRWIGVDGALRLTELLPAGASARGLRVTWDPAAAVPAPALTLDGVGVTFGVPDAFGFEGEVALTEDTATGARLFTGGLGLGLDALDVGIDAGITVGRLPDDTFVLVTLGVNVPIPIAATGAALYGLQGLFAMNMSPVVTNGGWPIDAAPPTVPKGDWYGWYKTVPPVFAVDEPAKWSPDPGAWAFGAGLTIGTLPDAGFSVNTKALLVVLLSGPVVLLEGKADIFKVPPQLSGATEGTLSLLAAVDGRAGTLQLGIDAQWSLVKVIEIAASTDAFFDFDRPEAWHLWLGQKTPESARIRADYLALWHADAWLMLDATGVNTGLGVGFGDAWTFGPARLVLEAWIGGEASLSTRPPQLAGQLAIGGEAAVSVGPFGTGIRVDAALSGESFAPYEVKGTLAVVVDVPKPFKDLDVEIALEWSQPQTPVIEDPWVGALVEHTRCTESWAPTRSAAGAAEDAGAPVVPLDATLVLTFAKPMDDGTAVADNPPPAPPVQAIGDYRARYALDSVRLFRKRRSHPGDDWTEVTDTMFGTWTPDAEGAGTRLQLLARSPFAFTRFTSRRWSDAFLATHPDWPCSPRPALQTACTHWRDVPIETTMPAVWKQDGATFASDADLTVLPASGGSRALRLGLGASGEAFERRTLWVALPEPSAEVVLDVVKGQPGPLVLLAWAEGRLVATDTQGGTGTFEMRVAATGIDAFTLDWTFEQEAGLRRVCWTTQASTDARETWRSARERLTASAERWSSEDAILEPECHYRLEVGTLAVLEKGDAEVQRDAHTHVVQFQTAGPPAIVPAWVPTPPASGGSTAPGFPRAGVLKDLAPYVRVTVPDAGARPVFRAYDVGCEFDATHVQQMYGADMHIRLRDGNGTTAVDGDGHALVFGNVWEEAPTTTLSESDAAWLARLDACTGAVRWSAIRGNDALHTAAAGLLVDDFSGAAAIPWSPFVLDRDETRPAAWDVADGVLRQTVDVAGGTHAPGAPDKPGTVYVATDVVARDVAVETRAWARSGAFGLVFRWRGPGDYLRFSLGPELAQLVRVTAGRARLVWSGRAGYHADVPVRLAIQAEGARVRCQIDDRLVCEVEVEQAGGAGAVGLYTWHSTSATFDDIRARPWPGATLAAECAYDAELEASRPLFTDAFESLAAFDTVVLSTGNPVTTCSASGGVARIAKPVNKTPVAALAPATFDGCSVECNARPLASGVIGIVVGHTGPDDYVSFEMGPLGRALVWRRSSGGGFALVTTLWSDAVAIEEAREYALAVRCEGATVTVTVDGETLAVRDVTALTGRIGLLSGIDAPGGCEFRDLVVRSAPRTRVHRWRFTTSRFLGLPDLAATFSGDVWPLAAALADGAALTAAASSAAADVAGAQAALDDARAHLASLVSAGAVLDVPLAAADAVAAANARQAVAAGTYDTLAGLLGLGYRPVPPIVELSRLDDAGTTAALLLELPEPLPWERMTWALTASADGGAPPAPVALAWSDDGARALIVMADGAPFPSGAWTLGLALHLDIGAERAVWRRGGSVAPEVARLSFRLP
jgi:hypothetical protein